MKDFNATRYKLKNIATERVFDDEGWTLEDKQSHVPSLIRAVYESKQIRPKGEEHGIYRFADWLPVKRTLSGSCAPVTYRSRKLAEHLGLKNLYITFNGYFPEIGARMTTCSFKETEAYSVCGRLNGKHKDKVLVVASAGNTARAFAKVCSDNHIPLLLSVPEENIDALWFEAPLDDCVKLISPRHGADYYDAIKLSDMALQSDKFFAEGGAKNVARRDGMATTPVLSAVTHIGRIPDYYFQAVGSGTGRDRRMGSQSAADRGRAVRQPQDEAHGIPELRPSFRCTTHGRRARAKCSLTTTTRPGSTSRKSTRRYSRTASPLWNQGRPVRRRCSTRAETYSSATNDEARAAKKLFAELEGVDIYSAPAVALATLIQSVRDGRIAPEEYVMLNVTGGGEKRFMEGKELFFLKPSHVFDIDPDPKEVAEKVEALFE